MALRAVVAPRHDGGSVRPRRLVFIAAAFVLFAVLIEPAGLAITVTVTAVVASLADPQARLWQSLALGVGLAAGIWLVFVVLLGLSIPLLPGQR